MTLENIWQQAFKDKSNSFFSGNNSTYTIYNGCKIECFENGSVVIKNTRLGGDFYKDLTKSELAVFESDGWHKGTRYVELQVYKKQVTDLNRLIQGRLNSGQPVVKLQQKRKNLLIKIHENPYTQIIGTSGEADSVSLPSPDA